MPLASVNATSSSFSPSTLLALFTLDSRFVSVNGQILRFVSSVNGLYQSVVFNSLTYTPFPIELTSKDINGNGTLPRPRLRASNINGFISAFLLTQGDLVGARLTVTRVYARYLDNVNWPGGSNPYGTPDTTAAYEDDIWWISRKITENPEYVDFEMSSPFELDNVKLPSRQMNATICSFRYRDGETCGYTGVPVMDRFGKSFTDAAPGGYGYTLNARGAWASGNTYAVGDWVYIISESDFTNGETLVYVCTKAATTGTANNPQFNATNWIADACPHNLFGCDGHFDSPIPAGFFAGIARASFIN